jgi:hypothetical protein
LEQKDLNERQ